MDLTSVVSGVPDCAAQARLALSMVDFRVSVTVLVEI